VRAAAKFTARATAHCSVRSPTPAHPRPSIFATYPEDSVDDETDCGVYVDRDGEVRCSVDDTAACAFDIAPA
jgi:hypothetical protein